ncbi:MAG: hypothetical protein ABI743_15390, partial [bacterium]
MRILSLALLSTAAVLIGCSGNAPTAAPTSTPGGQAVVALPLATHGAPPPEIGILGAVTVQLDPASLTATATPLRTNEAYGDNYWLNATGFLDGAPCKDCFGVTGVE